MRRKDGLRAAQRLVVHDFGHTPDLNDQLHHHLNGLMVRLLRRHGLVVNVFLPSVRLSISITCRPSTSDCNTYCAVCGVRFRGSNRNGPPAAVFHHGSTGREFALEHTSHCEKLATRPARDGIHHPASDTAGWDKPGFLDPVGSVCMAIDQAGPETAGSSRFGPR